MKRRESITLLGGAAAGWPIAAQAQQARMPVLGFLGSASESDYATTTAALRRGLNEAGYVEKQNLLIDYRWADFQYERLPALAAELVSLAIAIKDEKISVHTFETGALVRELKIHAKAPVLRRETGAFHVRNSCPASTAACRRIGYNRGPKWRA